MENKTIGYIALSLSAVAVGVTIYQAMKVSDFLKQSGTATSGFAGDYYNADGDDTLDMTGKMLIKMPNGSMIITAKKKGDKIKIGGKDAVITDNAGSWIYV